jgi:hypothetical protein
VRRSRSSASSADPAACTWPARGRQGLLQEVAHAGLVVDDQHRGQRPVVGQHMGGRCTHRASLDSARLHLPMDPICPRSPAAEVRALLGDEPLRRDLLIEYLHALQDRRASSARRTWRRWRSCWAGAGRGLRGGELLPPLRGRARRRRGPPARAAALTVRVCDGLSLRAGRRAGAAGGGCRRCWGRRRARDARALRGPLRAGAGGGGAPAPVRAATPEAVQAGRRSRPARATSPPGAYRPGGLPRRPAAMRCCATA